MKHLHYQTKYEAAILRLGNLQPGQRVTIRVLPHRSRGRNRGRRRRHLLVSLPNSVGVIIDEHAVR